MTTRSTLVSVFFGAVLFLAAGCGKKSDPVAAANAFFSLLRKGDAQAAYDSAAFSFQTQQEFQNFQIAINELGLVDYASIQWTPQLVTKSEASFDGVITRRNGANVPIAVTLVPESGEWKIYALRTATPDLASPATNRFSVVGKSLRLDSVSRDNVPSEQETIVLIQETFARIDEALRRKDFGDLYRYMAGVWRQQYSEKRLQEIFQPMTAAGARLDSAQSVDPIFEQKPYLNDAGQLVARGYFPTQPHRLFFSLSYFYELPKWKLVEIKSLSVEQ